MTEPVIEDPVEGHDRARVVDAFSVIVPVYNEYRMTVRCLRSVNHLMVIRSQ